MFHYSSTMEATLDVAFCLLKEVPKAWMERHRLNRGFGFQFAFMDRVLYN